MVNRKSYDSFRFFHDNFYKRLQMAIYTFRLIYRTRKLNIFSNLLGLTSKKYNICFKNR